MTDYVNILQGQIEEGRRSTHAATSEASTRPVLQKKKLVPLDGPSQEVIEETIETQISTESISPTTNSNQNKKAIYVDAAISPEEQPKTEAKDSNQPSNPPSTGGALWDPPKEYQEIRSSMKKPLHQETKPDDAPCLFDLVMQPPKPPLKPTLFTYFDKLMQMGEV